MSTHVTKPRGRPTKVLSDAAWSTELGSINQLLSEWQRPLPVILDTGLPRRRPLSELWPCAGTISG